MRSIVSSNNQYMIIANTGLSPKSNQPSSTIIISSLDTFQRFAAPFYIGMPPTAFKDHRHIILFASNEDPYLLLRYLLKVIYSWNDNNRTPVNERSAANTMANIPRDAIDSFIIHFFTVVQPPQDANALPATRPRPLIPLIEHTN